MEHPGRVGHLSPDPQGPDANLFRFDPVRSPAARLPHVQISSSNELGRARSLPPVPPQKDLSDNMSKIHRIGLSALLLGLAGVAGFAQIKSLTLEEMVETADNAVYGTIVSSHVFRVDHPVDGPEMYFTTLRIDGRSLADSTPISVDVTYHGGFLSETEGVFNSEAPSADDVKVGNRVVVFYAWKDNMGGGVAANAMVAAHGGLFRTVEGPTGATVLGRGQGYAVNKNVRVGSFESALGNLYVAKKK